MITKDEYIELLALVEKAVDEAFDCAKQNEKNENDFLLFLSRSNLREVKNENIDLSSWRISDSTENLFDQDRVLLLTNYLNGAYRFENEKSNDSKITLTLELMLYTHIWESNRNLLYYKRLTDLCSGEVYSMKVGLPNYQRSKFIRKKIRDRLTNRNLNLGKLVTESYSNQLRNAFAHSQYHFNMKYPWIMLENHDKGYNELRYIEYDQWTRRFLISTKIQNIFFNKFHEEILNLEKDKYYQVSVECDGITRKGQIICDSKTMWFNGHFTD